MTLWKKLVPVLKEWFPFIAVGFAVLLWLIAIRWPTIFPLWAALGLTIVLCALDFGLMMYWDWPTRRKKNGDSPA